MKNKFAIVIMCVLFNSLAQAQVSSTNGTFTAAGTTNFSMLTNTTPRVTILGSGGNAGFVGINKTTPAYQLDVNGAFNATNYFLNGSPFWTVSGNSISYAGVT